MKDRLKIVMRFIKLGVLAFVMFTTIAYAGQDWFFERVPENYCSTLDSCIQHYAEKYKVSAPLMQKIVFCESSNNPNAINSTSKEYSVGLSQINLYAHKHITEEQAKDMEFSLEFLASNLSKGKGNMWTCFRLAQK